VCPLVSQDEFRFEARRACGGHRDRQGGGKSLSSLGTQKGGTAGLDKPYGGQVQGLMLDHSLLHLEQRLKGCRPTDAAAGVIGPPRDEATHRVLRIVEVAKGPPRLQALGGLQMLCQCPGLLRLPPLCLLRVSMIRLEGCLCLWSYTWQERKLIRKESSGSI
jgi:hypothetical protein